MIARYNMQKYGHIDWKDLEVGMILLSSDRGGGPFNEEVIFIKAKRDQIIEFDSVTIRRSWIRLQYDDWATKYDWEEEVHLSGRPMEEESKRLFMWQFFHFAANEKKLTVTVRTRAELSKIPLEGVEVREIEREKKLKEEEKNKDKWR
jgi:hypothetical protein